MELLLAKIAQAVDGEIKGDAQKVICGVAPFEDSGPDDITFAGNTKYVKEIDKTDADTVIVSSGFLPETSKTLLLVSNPQVAFAKVAKLFHPPVKPFAGVSKHAVLGKDVSFGKDVSICSVVVVSDRVELGDRVILHPGVVIGNDVTIGNDTIIHPNVTILERCIIGNNVLIHAGSVIGSDGFGFAHDGEKYHKIPHTGIVRIDDDVEIGAGNTVDRAIFGKTWIQKGVKTDNLVHIAHSVTIGENTAIAGQVGISGSVTIGKHAVLAGQAGISDHLTIGDNATIGPQAGIVKSVPANEIVSGTPQVPHRVWLKLHHIFPRLPELMKMIPELKKRLHIIEEKIGLSE